MTVFLMLVTEAMPPTSDSLPLIGKLVKLVSSNFRKFLNHANFVTTWFKFKKRSLIANNIVKGKF